MNTLDVIILIFVLIPALLGLKKGFIKSIFSLISIIAGLAVATKFHSGLSLVLSKFIKDTRFVDPLAFIIIILVFYLIGLYIASKLSKTGFITDTLNKIGGFLFGSLKGVLFLSILFVIIGTTFLTPESQTKKSILYPYVLNVAPNTYNAVKNVLPFSKKDFNDLTKFFQTDSTGKK